MRKPKLPEGDRWQYSNSDGYAFDRRAFLASGLALSVTPSGLRAQPVADSNLPPHIPEWMRHQGAPILSAPYGLPSPFERNVVRRQREERPTQTAAASFSPLQQL